MDRVERSQQDLAVIKAAKDTLKKAILRAEDSRARKHANGERCWIDKLWDERARIDK